MKQLWIVLFAILAACVVPQSSEPLYPTTSGVYINGQALTNAQQAELAQLVGEPVPAGRYVLDNDGMFGLEGERARVNLAAHIRQRQGQGGGDTMMTDGRGSTMVGYGDCVSMTTPSGTFMGSGC
jgi:hypothetical protein